MTPAVVTTHTPSPAAALLSATVPSAKVSPVNAARPQVPGPTLAPRISSAIPTLSTAPSSVTSAPGFTPPEPLQPPLIYSSGPLATHPSNPLVARFMSPQVLMGPLSRVPHLVPRRPGAPPPPPPAPVAPQSMAHAPVPPPPRGNPPLKGALACEGCRYMHVRCNGSHPCDQCVRRRVPCSFVSYKRKPNPTTTGRLPVSPQGAIGAGAHTVVGTWRALAVVSFPS